MKVKIQCKLNMQDERPPKQQGENLWRIQELGSLKRKKEEGNKGKKQSQIRSTQAEKEVVDFDIYILLSILYCIFLIV